MMKYFEHDETHTRGKPDNYQNANKHGLKLYIRLRKSEQWKPIHIKLVFSARLIYH